MRQVRSLLLDHTAAGMSSEEPVRPAEGTPVSQSADQGEWARDSARSLPALDWRGWTIQGNAEKARRAPRGVFPRAGLWEGGGDEHSQGRWGERSAGGDRK